MANPGFIRPGFLTPGFTIGGLTSTLKRATGIDWAYLWLGDNEPESGDETLSLVSPAVEEQPTDGLIPSDLNKYMFGLGDDTSARIESLDSSFADIGESFAVLMVWRTIVSSGPAARRTIIGKRETLSPFAGWQMFLEPAGSVFFRADPGVPPTSDVGLFDDYADSEWHVTIARVSGGQLDFASEFAVGTPVAITPPLLSSVSFGLGDGLNPPAGIQVALLAFDFSASVETLIMADAPYYVYEALVIPPGGGGVLPGDGNLKTVYLSTGEGVFTATGEPYKYEVI